VSIHGIGVRTIEGEETTLEDYAGKTLLIVNVASQCGLTPQYNNLVALQEKFADRGFSVLGFPCNQFLGQEPGTNEEIQTFCALNYGVAFPLFDKIEVNGEERHPLFAELTQHPDTKGEAGDVLWNFEKFLVSPDGKVVARYRPKVLPDAPEIVDAIESLLPD
jgi:glutathione peroxidase